MKYLRAFLFSCLVFLGLGEMLTRLLIPIDPNQHSLDQSKDHPYIRTDWVPNFHKTYVIEGVAGQKGTMEFKINPFGFRSASMKTAAKPAGTQRIFFLGGSTTEEIYLPEEKTFPFLVESKLNQALPNQKFEGINNGISGYLAADVLAVLIYKVMYYEPDFIFVMLGVNDLRYGTVPSFDPIHRPNYRKDLYSPDSYESAGTLLAKLFKQSHFLTLIKWRILNRIFPPDAEKYKTKLEEYDAWRKERLQVPFTPIAESKSLDDFLKYMKEIIWTAKGHGVRLILMTEPSIYQENLPSEINEKLWMGWLGAASHLKINLSPEFLLREMNRFNDAVRKLSRDDGVELIDLDKEIPKSLDYFYDDVHFTPKGAEKASEVISSYLLAHPVSQSK